MGETGIFRFPGNLDPRAQEFWPRNNIFNQPQFPLIRPPPVYYPFSTPPPPPPPLALPPYPQNDVQVIPFSDGCGGGGVGYTQYPASSVYVSSTVHPPLPPPSASPTRALVLSSVPSDVSETVVRRDLEVFGEVRGVQMERVREGIVTVHFYDLRHAEKALKEIREQHMQQQSRLRNHYCSLMMQNNSGICEGESPSSSSPAAPLPPPAPGLISGRAVWAQFIVPANNAVPDGSNQGTVVIFNLDSGVTSHTLKDIFQAFGPVKELRETPLKKQQRFVEFYDVRDASKALREMNGKEIHGKEVVIEFSRPGGHNKKFFNANHCSTNFALINSNIYQTRNSDYLPPQRQLPPQQPPPPPPPSQSLPCKYSTARSPRSAHSSSQPFKKRHLSSSTSIKGNPNENGNVKIISSIESSMASLSIESGPLANEVEDNTTAGMGTPRKNDNSSKKSQMNETAACNKQQLVKNKSRPWKGRQFKSKFDTRFLINEDVISVSNCKDSRTTVMIKNIPNKYSQKLLLNMLDNHCIHCNEQIAEGDDQPLSSYDFVYLPIDFNNKCNVGYGFVNMTTPEATLRLYKAFHLQSWEVFNSRKICEVTYARVQGLEALKEHFKNSKFPSEMDHYLPVVFSPPRDGKQLTEPQPIAGLCKPSHMIRSTNSDATVDDEHDHDDLLLEGAAAADDTPDNTTTTANDSDCADQTDLLVGGSCGCSSDSPNGGDLAGHDDYDNDRDNVPVA